MKQSFMYPPTSGKRFSSQVLLQILLVMRHKY
jgi:hypothetical protein